MSSLLKIRLAVITLAVFLPTLFAQADPPDIGPCQVFPADNPWNLDVSSAPVDPNSANYIANINANGGDYLHPDFGSDPTYGIPFEVVNGAAGVPINFDPDGYEDESDPGPMPIPGNARIEGTDSSDGDRHVLVIDSSDCTLYELYYAFPNTRPATSWTVYSSAIWDLNSPIVQQRPLGWTSADAAGLPIFPGLARCDEANSGTINHAFRFTVNETQEKYIFPASHLTFGNTGSNYPPMGLRMRLKADYDLSGFTGQALAIAEALKKYGMMLADNGSNWYISGETNPTCWDDDDEDGNDDDLNQLKDIPGIAFEVVSILSPDAASPVQHYYTTPTALVTWNAVTWATSYEVQVSSNKNFTGTLADSDSVAANQSSFTTVALENGTYYWHVRALGGSSSWSPTESFIIRVP
jgi:hypothetical protein